jgi:hypothetical protein
MGQGGLAKVIDHDVKSGEEGVNLDQRAAPSFGKRESFYKSETPSVHPLSVNAHQAFNYKRITISMVFRSHGHLLYGR